MENRTTISIIPGGCLQFYDSSVDLNCEQLARFQNFYLEEPFNAGGGGPSRGEWQIVGLKEDRENDTYQKRVTREYASSPSYRVDIKDAFALFDGQWLPAPFLRLSSERWADDHQQKVERGPTNWARLRISRKEPGSSEFHVTLAFDTTVENRAEDQETYYALSEADVSENAVFRLASLERDCSWFIHQEWVMGWLEDTYKKFRSENPKAASVRIQEDGYTPVFADLACYLTLLEALDKAGVLPQVKVIDPAYSKPVGVELVLDIGNSRMTGLLVETTPQGQTNLNDSYLLQIRDLGAPERRYAVPIESKVEFSEANFGSTRHSASSSRKTPAFVWPSPVRVGPEAARLAPRARGAEGDTGMSSPKRYLWDERAREQQWRNSGKGADGQIEPPATRGIFLRHVNMEGTPLYYFQETKALPTALKKQTKMVAFEARFTRSSLMMFMLSEVIMQALLTINCPQLRSERMHANIPRHLKRIILTVPTAMPLAEQKIFQRWARLAVGMVWRSLGWDRYTPAKGAVADDYRAPPEICCSWDEATCTQQVFLYNEIIERYQGDVGLFFQTMGRKRHGANERESLRIASIDIGGGTTDLSITTYQIIGGESTTPSIRPTLNFRDGFNIAGDDVLQAVIKKHVLGALLTAAQTAGIPDARNLIGGLFKDTPGQKLDVRRTRGQWIRQLAVPISLAILKAYEQADMRSGNASYSATIREMLGDTPLPEEGGHVLRYLEDPLQALGAGEPFHLLDFTLTVDLKAVDVTVRQTLGQIMTDLGEIIHRYNCDILLLTGRPSCWQAVLAAPLAKVPVPPDRILPMHQYRVGGWYPFANALGTISDPKTTVLAGAFICALAENGHLPGFAFDTSSLLLQSTARYIGELSPDGQLKNDRVWFVVDATPPKEGIPALSLDNPSETKDVEFNTPMAIGFRQLNADRWTATRFYMLEYANEEASSRARNRKPYTVTLSYTLKEGTQVLAGGQDEKQFLEDEGELRVDSIVDSTGGGVPNADLVIRLQTLSGQEGYWMDTGILENI